MEVCNPHGNGKGFSSGATRFSIDQIVFEAGIEDLVAGWEDR